MRFGEFPTIRSGTKWWQTKAAHWQELVRAVKALANISVGSGMTMSFTDGGLRLELASQDELPRSVYQRVAVVELCENPEQCMMVRRVGHASIPPIQDDMAFHDAAFGAYPDVGTSRSDFDGFLWDADRPASGIILLDAYRVGGLWFVKLPVAGQAVRYVVVRTYTNPDASWVIVESVRKNIVASEWDGTWIASGTPEEMSVYPNQRAGDYEGFLTSFGTPVNADTNILPAIWNGREWEVWVYVPYRTSKRPRNLLYTDCVPVEAAS